MSHNSRNTSTLSRSVFNTLQLPNLTTLVTTRNNRPRVGSRHHAHQSNMPAYPLAISVTPEGDIESHEQTSKKTQTLKKRLNLCNIYCFSLMLVASACAITGICLSAVLINLNSQLTYASVAANSIFLQNGTQPAAEAVSSMITDSQNIIHDLSDITHHPSITISLNNH